VPHVSLLRHGRAYLQQRHILVFALAFAVLVVIPAGNLLLLLLLLLHLLFWLSFRP
jgi:hypothetical protein